MKIAVYKKQVLWPALGVLFASGCSSARPQATEPAAPRQVAAAQPTTPAPDPAPAASNPKGPVHKMWGIVESVDASARKFSIKSKSGRIHEFSLDANAKLTKGGDNENADFAELKKGDHVNVLHAGDVAEGVHLIISSTKS